jgi:hypothetical protein
MQCLTTRLVENPAANLQRTHALVNPTRSAAPAAPQHFSPQDVAGSSAYLRVEDLRRPTLKPTCRSRTRARHAPRPLRQAKLEAKASSPPLHSTAHFPPLPFREVGPTSPASAPTDGFRTALKLSLALPLPPLAKSHVFVVNFTPLRPRALVPHLLIARFARCEATRPRAALKSARRSAARRTVVARLPRSGGTAARLRVQRRRRRQAPPNARVSVAPAATATATPQP